MLNMYIDDEKVFCDADWNLLLPNKFCFTKKEDANVLCVGIDKIIDGNYIKECPNIEYILSPSTGIDHIKVSKKVTIINLIPSMVKDIRASSEYTLLLILSLLRKFNAVLDDTKVLGEDLYEKIVGLLGYGRIAKNLQVYLEAMGAKVIWHDIDDGKSKESVLEESDVVVVLVSSIENNRNYITYADFNRMNKCPYFVNVTRGFVVNDKALLYALNNKKIRGAALDVVENKDVFEGYLKCNNNLIITPHVAGSTIQSRKKACDFVIRRLGQSFEDFRI
jgi:phosphoglycerate dehydrogenase-like enzyme